MGASAKLFFDKTQQMFLIHAATKVNVRVNFSHVIKITMRHCLLLSNLIGAIEKRMHVEFGTKVSAQVPSNR